MIGYKRGEALAKVKSGDFVANVWSGWHRRITKQKVTRVTKTQVIINDLRYRKKDGEPVGSDNYSWNFIEVWTEEHDKELAAYRKSSAWSHRIRLLRDAKLDNVPEDVCDKACALLKELTDLLELELEKENES